jgi:hypothetical protein
MRRRWAATRRASAPLTELEDRLVERREVAKPRLGYLARAPAVPGNHLATLVAGAVGNLRLGAIVGQRQGHVATPKVVEPELQPVRAVVVQLVPADATSEQASAQQGGALRSARCRRRR